MDHSTNKLSADCIARRDGADNGHYMSDISHVDSPVNLADYNKHMPASQLGPNKLNRDLSKTLPCQGLFVKDGSGEQDEVRNQKGLVNDSDSESPSGKRNSLSPESCSRKSIFSPNNLQNSSKKAEGGTLVKPIQNNSKKFSHQQSIKSELESPQVKVENQRQLINNAFQVAKCDRYSMTSDHPKDKLTKNRESPRRRIQSILKKSKTNKNSVDTILSRESRRVQFNKYKQVMTFQKDKGI